LLFDLDWKELVVTFIVYYSSVRILAAKKHKRHKKNKIIDLNPSMPITSKRKFEFSGAFYTVLIIGDCDGTGLTNGSLSSPGGFRGFNNWRPSTSCPWP
jgi:hypothetical protein